MVDLEPKLIGLSEHEGNCLARSSKHDLIERLNNNVEIKDIKDIEVIGGERVEEICRLFDEGSQGTMYMDNIDIYNRFIEIIDSKSFSNREIYLYSFMFDKYLNKSFFESDSGLFLSALINSSKDIEFQIQTKHRKKYPNLFAYKNKNITLDGNCGEFMGFLMTGGKIIVNGDCDWVIGNGMSNGEIHLNGNYKSISKEIKGGDIYHKGKKIIENGKETGEEEVKWF